MRTIATLVAAAAAAFGSASAQTYLQVHGGVFHQSEEALDFSDEDSLRLIFREAEQPDAELGFAAGALVGRYVAPFLSFEGEVTLRTASTKDLQLEQFDEAFSDRLDTYAFMVNAALRPDLTVPLLPNPYIVAGMGVATSNLNNFDGGNSEAAFAWQLKGGITFDTLPTPGKLGLELGYLSTNDFKIKDGFIEGIPDAQYSYRGLTGLVTVKFTF